MLSNLFLLSSSKYRSTGFLVDARQAISNFLSDVLGEVVFIPYANAAQDYDDYGSRCLTCDYA